MASAPPPRVTCPSCQAPLKIVAFTPGEKLTCPKCQTIFLAPGAIEPATGAAANTGSNVDDIFSWGFDEPASKAATTPPAPVANKPASSAARPPLPNTPSPPAVANKPPAPPRGRAPASPPGPPTVAPPKTPLPALPFDDESLPVAARADLTNFTVPCPLCGSPEDFTSDQIGQEASCPDCDRKFVIPPPKPSQLRARFDQRGFDDETTLNLSAAVDRPPADSLASLQLYRTNADDMLAKASRELETERKRDASELATNDLTRVFKFMFHKGTISRWLVISICALLLEGLVLGAISQGQKSGLAAIGAIPLSAAAVLVGVAWSAFTSACCLTILRDTGSGNDTEVDWPEFAFFDWLHQSLYLFIAGFAALLPAILLTLLLASFGAARSADFLIQFLGVAGLIVIFPFVILSMLNENSLLAIYSRSVLRSLQKERSVWITFFEAALVLGGMLWLLGFFMVSRIMTGLMSGEPSIPWGWFVPVTFMLIAILIVYFRFLGWVAWRCRESFADDEEAGAE